jgi:hypothetical protein
MLRGGSCAAGGAGVVAPLESVEPPPVASCVPLSPDEVVPDPASV